MTADTPRDPKTAASERRQAAPATAAEQPSAQAPEDLEREGQQPPASDVIHTSDLPKGLDSRQETPGGDPLGTPAINPARSGEATAATPAKPAAKP